MDVTASDILYLTDCMSFTNGKTVPCYGSIEEADNYFGATLEGQRWMASSRDRKFKALVSATKRIDRLNFIGVQTQVGQPLQFPRGTDTSVPVDVQQACFELAQALLKGVDPDTEADLILTTFQGYGGLRTEYSRTSVQPWIIAGIPCKAAWDYLWPYLAERTGMVLTRVS